MRKNANIQSVEEAIKRLQEGEIFYFVDARMEYNESFIKEGKSPFRYIRADENEAIEGVWDFISGWETEVDWRQHIGDGILCWVGDFDYDGKTIINKHIELIVKVSRSDRYKYSYSEHWDWAKPMTKEEVLEYIFQ